MIGKKNIVFGFIYLVLTAALGAYMAEWLYPDYIEAQQAKQEAVGDLQTMEPAFLEPPEIAKKNTDAILGLNKQQRAYDPIKAIKGGPHSHGNLESVLNIAVGLMLVFVAVPVIFKQIISWLFIVGTLLHSGMLYLGTVFGLQWANMVLGTGLGPILLLIGFLLAGVAAAIGFRGEIVRDR